MTDNAFTELKRHTAQDGQVTWIGLSAERRGQVRAVDSVMARVGTGLDGDHHAVNGNSKRQVTLIQAEHLTVVAALTGRQEISPDVVRRNVVVAGINLIALKDQKFRIGQVILEGTGPCAPCSRMEEVLGNGGYNAMRGHGGICARVISAGELRVGDEVVLLSEPAADDESASNSN